MLLKARGIAIHLILGSASGFCRSFRIRGDFAKTYCVKICLYHRIDSLVSGLHYLKQLRALLLGFDVCWNLLICTVAHMTPCWRWCVISLMEETYPIKQKIVSATHIIHVYTLTEFRIGNKLFYCLHKSKLAFK